MKKLLTQFVLLLLPVFTFAQKDATIFKDFAKSIERISGSVKLNDHVYVVQVTTDEENFEVVAVNDKMQELWRTPLKGYAMRVGLFKGNVLAYGLTTKRKEEIYTGYLIDGKTGKILVQKVVYDSKGEYSETISIVFNDQGSIARLIVRESGAKKGSYKADKLRETKDLTIIDLDEKLEATVLKPEIPSGNFIRNRCNEQGDLFILTSQGDNTLNLLKYDFGKSAPSSAIMQNIDLKDKSDVYSVILTPSKTDNNIVYAALLNVNSVKNRVLTLCKFDFGIKTALAASTPFDKSHLKSLEKNFVPLYKKMPEPEMGSIDDRSIGHIEEYNGNLIVSIVCESQGKYQYGDMSKISTSANTVAISESFAIIIEGFDLKLQPKFEQVLPVYYKYNYFLQNSYHGDGNYYDILASNTHHDAGAYYSRIDLTTGKLVKFDLLSIGGRHLLDCDALWFGDSFLVPLTYRANILSPSKLTVDLLQAAY